MTTVTTTSTSTSTASTTGTVNMSSTYNQTALMVDLGQEKVSAFSRRNSTGGNVDVSNRHVYAVTLKHNQSGWATPNASDPQANFHSQRIWPGGEDSFQGSTLLGNPSTSNWTYNGESYAIADSKTVPDGIAIGAIRPGDVEHTFYLLSPGEMSNLGVLGTAATVAPGASGGSTAALSASLPMGSSAVCQLGSAGALTGGSLTALVKSRKWWHTLVGTYAFPPQWNSYYDPETEEWYGGWTPGYVSYLWKYHESTHWVRYDYTIPKLICDDTSIDTRKMYGQPNKDGVLPAVDPNSPGRPVNFDPADYKGGLFVGNIPGSTGDLSGNSRTQLYPRGGSVDATTKWATLSMLHMGVPTGRGTVQDLAVTAYAPSASDPNASVSNGNVIWDTRWSKDTAAAGQSITFNTAFGTDYANWHWDGRPAAVPTTLTSIGILLARATESDSIFNWHYFASKEHALLGSTLPLSDAQPRLWVVKETAVVRW